MALKSMTGFARSEGALDGVRWYWEVRSVNGRGLDIRVRVPAGMEALEMKARDAVTRQFVRGSISASLNMRRDGNEGNIRINEEALGQVIKAAIRVGDLVKVADMRPEGLLALKGVIESVEQAEDEAQRERLAREVLGSLETALQGVAIARRGEGQRLTDALGVHIDEVEDTVASIRLAAGEALSSVRERIHEQVRRLVEASVGLDPQRLHQEAVLIAARGDIEEEVKRLETHVASARELLSRDDAVGRRLDFLAQEFNREANTICSKAVNGEISKLGLSLKVVIDQFREQVQNIE